MALSAASRGRPYVSIVWVLTVGLMAIGCAVGTDVHHTHSHPHPGALTVEAPPSLRPELRADGKWHRPIGDGHTVEVSDFPPDSEPTETQQAAADAFAVSTRNAMAELANQQVAVEMGYELWLGLDDFHWVNRSYMEDGRVLDPDRPESVLYHPQTGEFLGVMFLADGWNSGPQFGGPLTVWHYHPATNSDFRCWIGMLPVMDDTDGQGCRTGTWRDRSPEMLHVWRTDEAGGPYSSLMGD